MLTVLVIDDHASNRDLLTTLLGYAGYGALEAATAEHALEIVRAARPDLVITDVLMPLIDGFEFVRRLRSEPDIALTPVIFYTATYLESETRTLAEACGVMHVLVKPVEPQIILDTIRLALDVSPSSRAMLSHAEFDHEHGRLLLSKLAQKVDQLETLNSELEQRVYDRTIDLAAANIHLQEVNQLKDDLLTIASHDLRSPLAAVQNIAELLLEDEDMPEHSRRRLTENIYQLAQRQIELVSRLLDLARLKAGKVDLEASDLYVSDVARQALDLLEFNASAKQITTELVIEQDEQLVLADWMKLSQILNNLLSNAIKFTSTGGHVTISAGPARRGTYVSVTDSGMGIPTEELPYLFEKFKQVHTLGTANERGSGLGLAIVQQLVELHGGSIKVTSELSHGSTFTFYLPAGDLASSVSA